MMKLLLTLLAFMATMAMNAGDFVSGGIVYNSTITDNDDGSRTFKLVLKDGSAAEGEVVIPEKLLVDGINELTLTEIGASAFENNTKITRVVIPDCVFEMGKSAFAGCTNLTSIDLPAKLETIPLKAFSGCIKLESVTVKSSFTGGIAARGVGDEAFKDCKSLKSIDLSKGAEEIGINAFYGCSSLESVILPTAGLDKLDNFCFKNCTALLSIHIPSSVTSIGEDIFAGCTGMVEAIVEKGSKTYAGKNLFLNCTGLKTATVGWEGTLPGSIFKGCSSLENVTLIVTNEISANAFEGCSSLTSIVWPHSIKAFGEEAFKGCSSLKEIDIPEGVKELPWGLFEDCMQLEHVSLPESLTTINEKAFCRCQSLESLKLPSRLTTIKASAFAMCNNLTSLTFPSTLTSLGTSSFYHCSALQFLDFRACTGLKIKDTRRDDKEELVFRTVPEETVILLPGDELPAGMGEGYAVFDEKTGTLTFKYEIAAPEGLNVFKNINDASWCWNIDMSQLKKVVFESSFANARPKSTFQWFYGATSLTEITGLQYLNTSEVTSMEEMFSNCGSLTSLDLSSFDTSSVTNMGWMFNNCTSLKSLNLSSLNTSNVTSMDWMFAWCTSLNRIYVSDKWNTSNVTSNEVMFTECKNLIGGSGTEWNNSYVDRVYAHIDSEASPGYLCDIKDKSKIDALGNPVGYAIFDEAKGTLTFKYGELPAGDHVYRTANSWDVDSSWDGQQLKKVIFDPSFANVRPMSTNGWFASAESLTEIVGIQFLNTSHVTDMSFMFGGCQALTSLDLSSFDTSSVTNMGWMFNNCTSLKTIYVGDKWSTQNVTSCENMFEGCEWLIGGLGTTFDENHIDDAYARIDGGNISPGYFTSSSERDLGYQALGYAIFDESTGTLTFKYGEKPSGKYVFDTDNTNYGLFSSSGPREMAPWAKFPITKVVFDPSYAKAHPKSTSWWFSYSSDDGEEWGNSITEFVGLEYLNTSYVKDMSFMFGCPNITSLDVSHFNTSNVINMHGMFSGCTNLISLDVSNFDTGKVRKMTAMFSRCEKLESLDVSHFNTSNVYDMWGLFRSCMSLKSIDVSHFDTRNVTEMGGLFHTCTSLTSLDVSNFDTSNVTSMYMMFWGCSGLKTIDLSRLDTRKVTKMSEMFMLCTGMTHLDLSNFDTSNVDNDEGFEYMFYGCMNLTSLNLSSFNTSKLQSLYCTFMGCESLKEIDLSNFDTEKVRAMAFMFYSCKNLQTIYVGEKWNTGNLTNPEDNLMFVDCNQLVGSKGTCYDANHTDTEYAHVDGENGAPGYFTLAYMDDGVSYLPSDDGSLQVRNATCKEVVDIPSSLYVEGQSMLVKGIRNEAFMDNSDLVIVSIPESIESIGTSAFAGCSGLKIIYCYATDPVALGSANARVFTRAGEEIALSVFEGVDKNSCVLYVPKGCTGKYKTASGWKEFAHIEEMPSNVKGDVNDDGVLDDKDLKAVVDHIIGKTPEGSFDVNIADINKDEKVNAADLVFFVKLMGQKR